MLERKPAHREVNTGFFPVFFRANRSLSLLNMNGFSPSRSARPAMTPDAAGLERMVRANRCAYRSENGSSTTIEAT